MLSLHKALNAVLLLSMILINTNIVNANLGPKKSCGSGSRPPAPFPGSCGDTATKRYCCKNRNNCGEWKVKWMCQRTCKQSFASSSRIVGGSEVTPHSLPWQVSLIPKEYLPTHRWPFCGGTLISDRHVMTAAHCLYKNLTSGELANLKDIRVVVGDHDFTNNTHGTVHAIKCMHIHPKWSTEIINYDFAVLTLKKVVVLGEYQQPACLPNSCKRKDCKLSDKYLTNKNLRVSGWGQLAANESGPYFLHSVNVPFVKWKTCKKLYPKGWIDKTMMCAGNVNNGGAGGCFGDSGGPLVKLNKPPGRASLVGVVSWGGDEDEILAGIPSCGAMTVFADVRTVIDWIHKKMSRDLTGKKC